MLPIEVYFSHENLDGDITATHIGAITLYFYKQVLIAVGYPDKRALEVLKLPIDANMYMRGVEIPYPGAAREIRLEHISYVISACAYPADRVGQASHDVLCEHAQVALMRDMSTHYTRAHPLQKIA